MYNKVFYDQKFITSSKNNTLIHGWTSWGYSQMFMLQILTRSSQGSLDHSKLHGCETLESTDHYRVMQTWQTITTQFWVFQIVSIQVRFQWKTSKRRGTMRNYYPISVQNSYGTHSNSNWPNVQFKNPSLNFMLILSRFWVKKSRTPITTINKSLVVSRLSCSFFYLNAFN